MSQARFGQVWTVGHDKWEKDLPHLIVSGDLYNGSGLGFIGAQVFPELKDGTLCVPIAGVGTAYLDMISWYAPGFLVEHVGELAADRHALVTRLVRNLIGN